MPTHESTPFHIFALGKTSMTTLPAKWLATPLTLSMIEPFIRSLNQQPAHKHYTISLEDIICVRVGGREVDMTLPTNTFVAGNGEGVMVHLEMRPLPEALHRPKPPPSSLGSATFQISAGEHLKCMTLCSKRQSTSLSTALIEPFFDAVNAKTGQTHQLTLADIARVVVNGEVVLDMERPTKSFVQPGRGAVQVEIEIFRVSPPRNLGAQFR